MSEQTLDEIEAECEKWLSDHPPRTRQSEFLTHYPDIRITDYGVIDICPSVMGAEVKGCGDLTCGACKTEYWLAEINEENEK